MPKHIYFAFIALLQCLIRIAMAVAICGTTSVMAAPMQLLVPAYFDPTDNLADWNRMIAAARSGVPITAIMNPNSGPGDAIDPSYVRVLKRFRAAGGKVLGYVPSGYTGHDVYPDGSCKAANGTTYTVEDVVGCAARYKQYYTIDGIFIDEFGAPANGAPFNKVYRFYRDIYNGLKAVDTYWHIMGNPGVAISRKFLRLGNDGAADTLVTFEDVAAVYAKTQPSRYVFDYSADRFAHILIETSATFDVVTTLKLTAKRNVGYFYATDDTLPNPYDRLPTTWKAEVAAVREFNARKHQ